MNRSVLLLCATLAMFYVAAEADVTCPAEDPSTPVFLEDPNDCASFYECSNGEAIHVKCSPGTYFDGNGSDCAWAEDVDCGLRPTTPGAKTTTQQTTPTGRSTQQTTPTGRSTQQTTPAGSSTTQ